jgi:hypothetical protein
MLAIFAVEPTEWTGWAIIALLITNFGSVYALVKKEKRTDGSQDAAREDSLAAQWRAWGKDMQAGRIKAEKRCIEVEDRERLLIAEVSRLKEQLHQRDDRIDELEHDADDSK